MNMEHLQVTQWLWINHRAVQLIFLFCSYTQQGQVFAQLTNWICSNKWATLRKLHIAIVANLCWWNYFNQSTCERTYFMAYPLSSHAFYEISQCLTQVQPVHKWQKSARIDVILWKSISPYGIFSPSKLKIKTSGSTQSSDCYEKDKGCVKNILS